MGCTSPKNFEHSYTSFLHYFEKGRIYHRWSLLLHQMLVLLVVVGTVHVFVSVYVLFGGFLLVFVEGRFEEVAGVELEEGGDEPARWISAHVSRPILLEMHVMAHHSFVALYQSLVVFNGIPEIPNEALTFIQPVDGWHDGQQIKDLIAIVIHKVTVIESGDGKDGQAVNEHVYEQMQVHLGIVLSDAVPHPGAMVVHSIDADVAPPAVIITGRFYRKANRAFVANPLLQNISPLPLHALYNSLVDYIPFRLFIPPQPHYQNCYEHRMVLHDTVSVGCHDRPINREDEQGNNHVELQIRK